MGALPAMCSRGWLSSFGSRCHSMSGRIVIHEGKNRHISGDSVYLRLGKMSLITFCRDYAAALCSNSALHPSHICISFLIVLRGFFFCIVLLFVGLDFFFGCDAGHRMGALPTMRSWGWLSSYGSHCHSMSGKIVIHGGKDRHISGVSAALRLGKMTLITFCRDYSHRSIFIFWVLIFFSQFRDCRSIFIQFCHSEMEWRRVYYVVSWLSWEYRGCHFYLCVWGQVGWVGIARQLERMAKEHSCQSEKISTLAGAR